jgi:class 3 adenylate cyclase
MMGDSQYVACHAPEVANVTGAIVVCAEGRASLGDRRANFTHFLGIVSEMAAQAVVQVRRSRIARYVSPSVASMLARGGQDALEQEPVWREAACVFLDLQGFSAAVDGDESALPEVHAQMQSLMDGLARAVFDEQGMVVDFTGDGLFAAFGVPAPREGHVASALRAAMAMRAVAPASRVGLDVGRCLFGPMGARQHAKLGLFGRVVNRASRMEALGRPERLGGGLLCTGAVVADPFAHRAADFLRLGRVQPAGLQEAVEVFEVVPPGSLDSTLLEALCLASVELEEARESGAFAALAARLEARSVDHVRFGWLAGHARRLVADPSGWDGVHRPGK